MNQSKTFDELADMADENGEISLDIRLELEKVRVIDEFAKQEGTSLHEMIKSILYNWVVRYIEINKVIL